MVEVGRERIEEGHPVDRDVVLGRPPIVDGLDVEALARDTARRAPTVTGPVVLSADQVRVVVAGRAGADGAVGFVGVEVHPDRDVAGQPGREHVGAFRRQSGEVERPVEEREVGRHDHVSRDDRRAVARVPQGVGLSLAAGRTGHERYSAAEVVVHHGHLDDGDYAV